MTKNDALDVVIFSFAKEKISNDFPDFTCMVSEEFEASLSVDGVLRAEKLVRKNIGEIVKEGGDQLLLKLLAKRFAGRVAEVVHEKTSSLESNLFKEILMAKLLLGFMEDNPALTEDVLGMYPNIQIDSEAVAERLTIANNKIMQSFGQTNLRNYLVDILKDTFQSLTEAIDDFENGSK